MPSFVMKKHLKREQAVKELTKKSVLVLNKKHLDAFEVNGDIPISLRSPLQSSLNKIGNINTKIRNGENYLEELIEQADDTQLASLKSIFKSTTGLSTESKLFQSSHVLLQELDELDTYIEHIKKVKHDLVVAFASAYAEKYSALSRSGSLEYTNEQFASSVSNTIIYRSGLRRATNDNANAEGDNPDVPTSGFFRFFM